MYKVFILTGILSFLACPALMSENTGDEVTIPMTTEKISFLYNPGDKSFINAYGVTEASDNLTIDLGEIDFGEGNYDQIAVDMSTYRQTLTADSRFDFYIDEELKQPDKTLEIPLNLPVIPYASAKQPQSGLFYKTKYYDQKIIVFDIRNDDNVSKMVSAVLQGILNQEYGRIYLYSDHHYVEQLNDTKRSYSVEAKYNHALYGGFGAMVKKYGKEFDKLVVWDEQKEWTWPLAQMICAQEKGIPVTETLKTFLVNQLGWNKEIQDIRNNWSDKYAAYDWALENLAPHCHKTLSFSAGLREDYKHNPWRIYDYASASKGFVFWLDHTNPKDMEMIGKIFTTMNYRPGSATMGYGTGKDGDGLNAVINQYNAGFMVSDYYANGSFWCSYPSKAFEQRKGQAIDALPGKIYTSIIWSDGDNIQFDANMLYYMIKNAPDRGKIPVGITMASVMQEMNPFLLEFFYKSLTPNDELVAGPSGFQFIYGDSYNASGYNAWLQMNNKWLETAGFHTACFWNTTRQDRFEQYMETCGLQGIFDGWSRSNNKYYGGVVAVNQGEHCPTEGDVYNALKKQLPRSDKPVFVNAYPTTAAYGGVDGYKRLIRELERLEADSPNTYVYLLPMDLCATLVKYIQQNGGKY